MRLQDYYNSYYDPSSEYTQLWCPILQGCGSDFVAAHTVPQSIGYRNAGYLFGEPDNGMDVIWSMKNGLITDQNLEKQFDRGAFVSVPIPTQQNEPTRWKFVLMDQKLGPHRMFGNFKNDQRPGSRYLYYHYVTTLLRYVRFEKPGWAEKRIQLPTGKIWATPGPYLRRSMLYQLAGVVGEFDAAQVFYEGTFVGEWRDWSRRERNGRGGVCVSGVAKNGGFYRGDRAERAEEAGDAGGAARAGKREGEEKEEQEEDTDEEA